MRALESLLLEKGILAPDAVDRVVARYERDAGPMVGARAVARAWTDPAYRGLLLADARTALAAFDLDYAMLVVVENTLEVHNLVVCTLCSCYPWPVLGLPPTWYKMPAYRSRAVSEPRVLLGELGLIPAVTRAARLGLAARRCATWCSPSAPPAPSASARPHLVPLTSPRDALIGVTTP